VLFTALLLHVCAGFGVRVFLVSIAVLSYAVQILTVCGASGAYGLLLSGFSNRI